MSPKEPKISKEAATDTRRHITYTIPETLEITVKPGIATCQSVIIAVCAIGLMVIYSTEKQFVRGYKKSMYT
jgi:hypothetical protein